MAFYNAIIRNECNNIIGRSHVKDLSTFFSSPNKWIVRHNGRRLSTDFRLESILSGPNNLLVISKRPSFPGTADIVMNTLDGRKLQMSITTETTVQDLKEMIAEEQGRNFSGNLAWVGRILEDGLLIYDHHVQKGSELNVRGIRIRGGGICLKDLEGQRFTGTGKPLDPKTQAMWMGFKAGLNIIGSCINPKCESRRSTSWPILNRRFGHCRLYGDLQFCPACNSKSLKPINILVSGARSAINFRKSGEFEVRPTSLESPGEHPNYIKLADGNDEVEYDEVEVSTCKLNESPFYCYACSTAIKERDSEVVKPCGHYFHECCAKRYGACPVCNADLVCSHSSTCLVKVPSCNAF